MFKILPETHKRLAECLYHDTHQYYHLELNKEKLLWGSVAPDFLPKYKIKRHYRKESKAFLTKLMVSSIRYGKKYNVLETNDPVVVENFSKMIGIISHYLSDFVCLPHAQRWTFNDALIKHISYEKELNKFAESHTFSRISSIPSIQLGNGRTIALASMITSYINDILNEYDQAEASFATDLDFAYDLTRRGFDIIWSCIGEEYNTRMQLVTSFA